MKMKMLQTFFRSRNHHLLCATDTAIGIISLPLMSVIYFDSVASLAWVGRNQLNKHISSWKASWLSTTWREWYRIVAMFRKPSRPNLWRRTWLYEPTVVVVWERETSASVRRPVRRTPVLNPFRKGTLSSALRCPTVRSASVYSKPEI